MADQGSFAEAVEALDQSLNTEWTVLLQSPRSAWFAKRVVRKETCEWQTAPDCLAEKCDVGLPDGKPESWKDSVFEFRAWNGSSELRWVRRAGGGSLARVRWSRTVLHARPGDEQNARRLLWGTVVTTPEGCLSEGWSLLATARIGTYPVPVDGAGDGTRIALSVSELWEMDNHGNVGVIDEYVTALIPIPQSGGNSDDH